MTQPTTTKLRWKDLPLHLKLLLIGVVVFVALLFAMFFVTGMMILVWGEPA